MKLYERFSDKNYHTSIATTFGIGFDAYENIVLPRLRGAGCRNNIVITDNRMLTHALGGASALPRQAGKLYTVDGTNAGGIFHPKVFLQVGRKGGRLIVGSANLTVSGLAGNLEIVELLSCDTEDSGEQRLIAGAWNYVSRLIPTDQVALSGQRDWMLARAAWLGKATPATGAVQLSDLTAAALLTTGETTGIGQRFADLITGPVSRLVVISPYWDTKLAALSYLIGRFNPQETAILLDPETALFPKSALNGLPDITLYKRGDFRQGRFIHAKAIIVQTKDADHVLMGSANCTVAALGTGNFAGENEEVCLYRRLPPGSVLTRLELGSALTSERIINADTLEEPSLDEELPLDELAAQAPGRFECRVDILNWWPATAIEPESCTIELTGDNGQPLRCQLLPLGAENGKHRYQISGTDERPSFARLAFRDGHCSASAIVTLTDRLNAETWESGSRKTENALRELDGGTEESLWLLEVLDVLEKLEPDNEGSKEPVSIPKAGRKTEDGDTSHFRVLSYEEFLAGRRPRTAQSKLTYSSIAGSEVSPVREFLNRILGMAAETADNGDEDEAPPKSAFDLGDETANAEAAIASGQEFDKTPETPDDEQQENDEQRRKTVRRKATKKQIGRAARTFAERVKERKDGNTLNSHDILRLRALLMIVSAASFPGAEKDKTNESQRSSLQALPSEGDTNSWPLVMGRLLFSIFGGSNPAIRQFHLRDEHDQIPGDIIECWATCYWCIQACLNAPIAKKERIRIIKYLKTVTSRAYQLTLPTKAELLGDDVTAIMDRMSARYADKLTIEPAAIAKGHLTLVASCSTKTTEATQHPPQASAGLTG